MAVHVLISAIGLTSLSKLVTGFERTTVQRGEILAGLDVAIGPGQLGLGSKRKHNFLTVDAGFNTHPLGVHGQGARPA